jgi:hypothetical protein
MTETTLEPDMNYNQPKIQENIVYELCIETTKLLNQTQDKLAKISWTNGEANIDTEYSELACSCCRDGWEIMKQTNMEYSNIDIQCEIPDINISFIYPNGEVEKYKIELKSSKSARMPGSTIKKLNINQPLIYCLRPITDTEPYKLRCSQYHTAMGESNTDLFQDRTPRPFLNFEKMNTIDTMGNILPFENKTKDCWIEHYANCALNRINNINTPHYSWQDDMVKLIKQKIIKHYINNTSEQQFHIDKISTFTT